MEKTVILLDYILSNDDDDHDEYFSSSSEDSDDSIEEELLQHCSSGGQRQGQPNSLEQTFLSKTIPEFNKEQFKSHFRMYPDTFEYVLSLIGPTIEKTNYSLGCKPMAAKKQLLLTIWIIATPDSYRSVCEKFVIKKATAIRTVQRVTHALYCLAPRFIQWPKGNQASRVMADFEKYSAFPGIVGAIDGTHIKINAPKSDGKSYINRKGYASIQVQAVCTHDLLFTSVFAGNTGSVHDARVFRLSPVQKYISDEEYFPGNSHLVGDAAYGIHPRIMVPFRDNGHLTTRQINYNFCLSSARISIERAFGIWKARWRRIRDCLPMIKTEKNPEFLVVTCILHNICILKGDHINYENVSCGSNADCRRSILTPNEMRAEGISKRNEIMQNLILRNN